MTLTDNCNINIVVCGAIQGKWSSLEEAKKKLAEGKFFLSVLPLAERTDRRITSVRPLR